MIKKFLSLMVVATLLISMVAFSTVNAAVTDYVNLIPNGNFDGSDVIWQCANQNYAGKYWMFAVTNNMLKNTRANNTLVDTYTVLNIDMGETYVYSGKIKTDSATALNYSIKAGQYAVSVTPAASTNTKGNFTSSYGDALFAYSGYTPFSISAEDGWVPFLSVFTTSEDSETYQDAVRIGVSVSTSGTPDYLDDMSLVKCPAAGEAYDTGTGIVVNRTGTTGTAICALYSGNKLVKLETSEDDIFVVPYDSSVGTVTSAKVFFWDSFDTMTPVDNVINVQMQP